MLVLSRKAQQSIRVGDSITITILRVKGNSVRVGIEAPDEVRIIRGELPDFDTAEGTALTEEEAEVPKPLSDMPQQRALGRKLASSNKDKERPLPILSQLAKEQMSIHLSAARPR